MTPAGILVVEDNPATLKMMRLALKAEGYEVFEAEDGATAIRIVKEHLPALVLLDCKLPDVDGMEVGRQLHAIAPNLPIIAVTGWAQNDEILSSGFLDVLVKPVGLTHLVETVQRYIGHGPLPVAPTSLHAILADDDPMQRKLAQLALTSAGFRVTAAEDGESAVRLARLQRPDVIVSDVLMPHMDGFAVCKAIRSDPKLSHVPIVLMSAHYVEAADCDLARRFGATRYVSRTDGFDPVVRAAHEAIDAPRSGSECDPDEQLQNEHLSRIAHQLERQASISIRRERSASLEASALSVLDGLADSLAHQIDPESALGDTLAKCLDAAGVSVGAILLLSPNGQLAIKAHVGSSTRLEWEAFTQLFITAISGTGIIVPSLTAGKKGTDLLAALKAKSALLVPIFARGEALGVLVLASNGTDLAGAGGEAAARAARSVSVQLGQAIALNRMFARLSSAEERYRVLLENAHDGIAITTPEGVLLEVNRRMEELLGSPREQVIGRHIGDFATNGGADGGVSAYDEAVAKGSGSIPPVSIERPDGTVVQVEFSSTVVEIGAESFVLSIGRDVSHRLRLEEQLRQSQKMDAIGRLAGGIAHDFNNVLSVILSYSEMLLKELRPRDPMRDDIEQIHRAGKRAAALTRQLLMFSRQQVIAPKVVDLNEVLVGIDSMLQRILGSDIHLVSIPKKDIGRVRVDPGSIEQVIMNLVVNARDAMPKGGKLTMETANVFLDDEYARQHHGVKAGPHVMLAVTDTGVGMDKATQARMFEPFYTTKGAGKGTGLGLSTVFGIVEQSGGSVWAYSEPGRGTTFKIYLPSVNAALDVLRPAQAAIELRGSETVLLVEDDEQVRNVARDILDQHGYHVLDAGSAAEALLHSDMHAGPIHLLLTDVVMPLMSGPELAKRLSSLRPDMKILCMSGYTDDSIVRHGVLESNMAYVQKPFTPEVLTLKVREVLDDADAPLTLGVAGIAP